MLQAVLLVQLAIGMQLPMAHVFFSPAAQQAQAQKVARDLEFNRQQQEKAQRRALRAQVEQLVEQARLPRLESDDYYSFVDGEKVRRIAVDADGQSILTTSP